MSNIKMLKTAMVGNTPRRRGWTGPADDAEAEALITAGYAAKHTGPLTDDKAAATSAHATLLEGTVAEVSDGLVGMSKADLKALGKLEGKGKDRAGVHAAIAAASESAAE